MKWQRLSRLVKQSTQNCPDAPHTVWQVPNFVQEGRGNGGSWRSLVSECGKTLCSWCKRMLLIFKAKHISDPFDIFEANSSAWRWNFYILIYSFDLLPRVRKMPASSTFSLAFYFPPGSSFMLYLVSVKNNKLVVLQGISRPSCL